MEQNMESSFYNCCRLCAEEHEATVTLFSKAAESMLLVDKLHKYLLVEVDVDDNLPKNICTECCVKLTNTCDFIETAQRSQEILLERSLILEQTSKENQSTAIIKTEVDYEDEIRYTQMEVNADQKKGLQNTKSTQHSNKNMPGPNDVTYLYNVDKEVVSIKYIKNEDNEFKEGKPFPCPTCKRSFFTELALKNHSWSHSSEPPKEESFRCKRCSEEFDCKISFVHHLRKHKSDGYCQLCSREFRSERTYIAHMAVHMTTHRSFTCKICGRIYNTWGDLKTHSVTHSSERPYPCTYCKKRFKRNQDLKFHLNQHTGARPYKCPFCEKAFASSGNCYSHRTRMHPGKRVDKAKVLKSKENGLKPGLPKVPVTSINGIIKYECQLCHHTFLKKDNYNYHMYQHTGVKPFNCSLCEERFVTRRGLLLHHNTKHPGSDRPLALITKNLLLK